MLRTTTTTRSARRPAPRRGIALLLVMAMISLFAVVGITVLYFTRDMAEDARIRGTPSADAGFPDDGTAAAGQFLGFLLFDTDDANNPIRGHSVVRTMYSGQRGAYIAWNGTGTIQEDVTVGIDPPFRRAYVVNHKPFAGLPTFTPEYMSDGTTFRAKNAPYTYPDMKDFYLASINPATGEIQVPSFSRFGGTGGFGPLDPTNPNWTNASGLVKTLRPTQYTGGGGHPKFPLVPPNADGTYTGDVQNLPGGFVVDGTGRAVARNDSIWIDIGLPPITLPNGRRVKPMVAPLILDLDGRLNLSVHGNTNMGYVGPPLVRNVAHMSGHGLGPWEVNLERLLGAEAQALVNARGTITAQTTNTRAYAPYFAANQEFPGYAQIAWRGFSPSALTIPGTGAAPLYATSPAYGTGYGVTNTNSPNDALNHPAVFNPAEWPYAGSTHGFSGSDLKALIAKYGGMPGVNAQMSFAAAVPTSLRGGDSSTLPNPNPPQAGTNNSRRLDAAHPNRQAVTTRSYSRDVTGPGANAFPELAPLDLNRPLPDYRDLTNPMKASRSLAPDNIDNRMAADAARTRFAFDIFARLVVTTAPNLVSGGQVVLGSGVVTVTDQAVVIALRPLAQIAANIVDYIDDDDISTLFRWNPAGAVPPDQIVFGVEKPRLVLNEAYSEVVNDRDDPALQQMNQAIANPLRVRFWLELQNPGTLNPNANSNPIGDGSVTLKYPAAAGGPVPYRVEIVQNGKGGGNVTNRLYGAAGANNVTGDIGVAPDLVYDFLPAGAAGAALSPANGAVGAGIAVCAPMVTPVAPNPAAPPGFGEFVMPAPGGGVVSLTDATPTGPGTLTYVGTGPAPGSGGTIQDVLDGRLNHHVVVLRRLANPYATPGPDNPYITVDVLNGVRSADRVLRTGAMNRQPKPAANGFDPNLGGMPDLRPQSYGKVQPYASYTNAPFPAPPASPTYPASMVLRQDPSTPDMSGARHTLGWQNSRDRNNPPNAANPAPGPAGMGTNDTLLAPFDWVVHLDRPLVNQLELFHVTAGRPHEWTYNVARPGGGSVEKFVNTPWFWLSVDDPRASAYARAFDLLRVRPNVHQAALGGRVPGRINLNTIQDKRVFDALFDAQGNGYGFDQAFVDALWGNLIGSRTRTMDGAVRGADGNVLPWAYPVPRATVYDDPNPASNPNPDRPFVPFGAGSLDDTTLRRAGGTGLPLIAAAGPHPYVQAEAARKILNNTTSTSSVFAVWMTVGYFDVEADGTYGREYYREVPADLRQKFFAVIDRTNIGMDPAQFAAGTPALPTARPVFTTLESEIVANTTSQFNLSTANGQLYSDGVAVSGIATLVVGVGSDMEIVSVSIPAGSSTATVIAVLWTNGAPTPAMAQPTTFQRNHSPGESVSNIVPGNPGPQRYDPNSDPLRAVVPHFSRIP